MKGWCAVANSATALDKKTIAKLAIANAYAMDLRDGGELIGPLTRRVLERFDTVGSLKHFASCSPR